MSKWEHLVVFVCGLKHILLPFQSNWAFTPNAPEASPLNRFDMPTAQHK